MLTSNVIASFSKNAFRYDAHAHVQQQAARHLLEHVKVWCPVIPPGPILEVGCGTGLLTTLLRNMFPEQNLIATDASSEMLSTCHGRMKWDWLSNRDAMLMFTTLDAEHSLPNDRFALIASNFVLHWFQDLRSSLKQLLASLVPSGVLVFSVPVAGSFPEWRQAASKVGVPFTANELPTASDFVQIARSLGYDCITAEERISIAYPSALDFFRSLKALGASTSLAGNRLRYSQLRRLIRHWHTEPNGQIRVSYKVCYGKIITWAC